VVDLEYMDGDSLLLRKSRRGKWLSNIAVTKLDVVLQI
jgi:hypothetical protein